MPGLSRVFVRHLGGNYPIGHTLAGQAIPTMLVTDIRRKQYGGPSRGERYDWAPGEERYIEKTPEVEISMARGMLASLANEGVFEVQDETVKQFIEFQEAFEFDPNSLTGTNASAFRDVDVLVVDVNSKRLISTPNISFVVVEIIANAAGGATLALPDGSATSLTAGVGAQLVVPIVNGKGTVRVIEGANGDVTVGLVDAGATGLDVTDTLAIDFTP